MDASSTTKPRQRKPHPAAIVPILVPRSLLLLLSAVALPVPTAKAEYHTYWGDLHGHTAHSDGKGSLDHYFVYARDTARLDFVAVSDHDYGNAAPWRLPPETWALTNDKVDEYTVNGSFVAIAGYEWTSLPKYWTPEEALFRGPVRYYNHKNVYFPGRLEYLFSARDPAYNSPDLLAHAVQQVGGLIHNNHLNQAKWPDQFDYGSASSSVFANSEMWADTESLLREYPGKGNKTGFVGVSDTHFGQPAARTAVLARELSRPAIFDALRHRRTYAVYQARIALDVRIDGHFMGEEFETTDPPRIAVEVHGTDQIEEVVIVRDGAVIHALHPGSPNVRFD